MVSRANIQSDKRLTNTSVRKHLCQKLMENQVPDTQAVQITGHKNPNSLNNYRSLNSAQKNHISSLLANTNTVQQHRLSHAIRYVNCSHFWNTAWHNQTHKISSHQAHKSVFCGSAIHGGVFNITINNNSVLSRKTVKSYRQWQRLKCTNKSSRYVHFAEFCVDPLSRITCDSLLLIYFCRYIYCYCWCCNSCWLIVNKLNVD